MRRLLLALALAAVAAPVLVAPAAQADHLPLCDDDAACAAQCLVDSTDRIRWHEWSLWVRRNCLS